MLAYGGGSIKKNGIYDELIGILKDAGKTVTEFSGIMQNPTYTKVQEGAALATMARGWLSFTLPIIAISRKMRRKSLLGLQRSCLMLTMLRQVLTLWPILSGSADCPPKWGN